MAQTAEDSVLFQDHDEGTTARSTGVLQMGEEALRAMIAEQVKQAMEAREKPPLTSYYQLDGKHDSKGKMEGENVQCDAELERVILKEVRKRMQMIHTAQTSAGGAAASSATVTGSMMRSEEDGLKTVDHVHVDSEDAQRLKRLQVYEAVLKRIPHLTRENWREWLIRVRELKEQLGIKDGGSFWEAAVLYCGSREVAVAMASRVGAGDYHRNWSRR